MGVVVDWEFGAVGTAAAKNLSAHAAPMPCSYGDRMYSPGTIKRKPILISFLTISIFKAYKLRLRFCASNKRRAKFYRSY